MKTNHILNTIPTKELGRLPDGQLRSRYQILRNPDNIRRTLIDGAAFVITTDQNDKVQILANHSIYIVDGVIQDVFPASEKDRINMDEVDLVYDGSRRGGVVVTPGFINAHTHPPMYLLRSSMTLDKGDVIDQVAKMAKLEAKMNDDDFYISTVGDFTEEQKNGITTTLSHYADFNTIEKAAKLTRQNVINAFSVISNSHPENCPEMIEEILENRDQYFTQPAIAIHYLHKANKEQLAKIKKLIDKYNILFTMHAAETEKWVKECVDKLGKRTVEALVDANLAGPNIVLSHGVHLSEKEIELVSKYKIGVVHLPTSNKLHRSGEFKYSAFVRHGADKQIMLGTDSVVSKNSLDLLSEALQMRIMHQHKQLVHFEDLFKMMTSQAADVLNLKNLGKIQPGYRADIAFWKLRDRGFMPYDQDRPASLIGNMITHGGRNVRDLMIDGQFVISSRTHNLIDESELLSRLQQSHMDLRKRLDNEAD